MAKKFESHLTDEELAALDAEMEEEGESGTELATEAMLKKAAALASQGVTKVEMAKKLSLSMRRVNNLYKDERFKGFLQSIGDDAVAAAKSKTRSDLSRMQTKAMKALENNLDKQSLEAVKVWMKAVGMDQEKEGQESNAFTLVLANQKPQEKVVVVKKEGEQ